MKFKLVNGLLLSCVISACPLLVNAAATAEQVSPIKNSQAEGRVLGVLIVLNKNEIASGELAEKKSKNEEVKNFAGMMIKEHGENLKKTEALSHELKIKPIKDAAALKLQNQGKKEAMTLKKLKGTHFDKAYVNAMVKGHSDALILISGLSEHASNPEVKTQLEETRQHVADHLKSAEAIQKNLK